MLLSTPNGKKKLESQKYLCYVKSVICAYLKHFEVLFKETTNKYKDIWYDAGKHMNKYRVHVMEVTM